MKQTITSEQAYTAAFFAKKFYLSNEEMILFESVFEAYWNNWTKTNGALRKEAQHIETMIAACLLAVKPSIELEQLKSIYDIFCDGNSEKIERYMIETQRRIESINAKIDIKTVSLKERSIIKEIIDVFSQEMV